MSSHAQVMRRMAELGRRLVGGGLVHSCVGNMSVRVEDRILISATGAMLDELGPSTIIEMRLEGDLPPCASHDAPLHLAIYRGTSAGAIIHTHSPFAVASSLMVPTGVLHTPEIEGERVLRGIPLVPDWGEEGPDEVVRALTTHRAVLLRGHGVVAIGASLDDAFVAASFAEHACKIRYLLGGGHKPRRSPKGER